MQLAAAFALVATAMCGNNLHYGWPVVLATVPGGLLSVRSERPEAVEGRIPI